MIYNIKILINNNLSHRNNNNYNSLRYFIFAFKSLNRTQIYVYNIICICVYRHAHENLLICGRVISVIDNVILCNTKCCVLL